MRPIYIHNIPPYSGKSINENQCQCTMKFFLNNFNISIFGGFVKISATLLDESTLTRLINPSCTRCVMRQCLTSMCLMRGRFIGSLANAIPPDCHTSCRVVWFLVGCRLSGIKVVPPTCNGRNENCRRQVNEVEGLG